MRILLVQPPFSIFKTESKKCHPPLGLAYLAGILRNNHKVIVLDTLAEGYNEQEIVSKNLLRYGLSFKEVKMRVETLKPDVVAISCLFSSQSENVHKICLAVKEANEKIITIVGGAHSTVAASEMLKDQNIDFTIIGEGELVLTNLLESLELNKDFYDLEGAGFRSNGNIRVNERRNFNWDLDSIPIPYWEIFPLERYFKINSPHGSAARRIPFLPMITSRGCPFECIFCSVQNIWGRGYRTRSPENVLFEINHIVDKFGVKEILFEDDNLTLDKNRANKIFQGIIEHKFNVLWSVPNGIAVQTLNSEMLDLMKRSGCYSISIGIESGDEFILKNIIKKPITLSNIKPIIEKANNLGLETTGFFVVGIPGENIGSLKNTFSFAKKIPLDNINFFFATPLPGTRLLQLCREKKLITNNLNYSILKSDYPSFANKGISTRRLYSLVMREKLKIKLRHFLNHPIKFIKNFLAKLKTDPTCVMRLKNILAVCLIDNRKI